MWLSEQSSVCGSVSSPVCVAQCAVQCVWLSVQSSVCGSVSSPVCVAQCAVQCVWLSVQSSVCGSVCSPVCVVAAVAYATTVANLYLAMQSTRPMYPRSRWVTTLSKAATSLMSDSTLLTLRYSKWGLWSIWGGWT